MLYLYLSPVRVSSFTFAPQEVHSPAEEVPSGIYLRALEGATQHPGEGWLHRGAGLPPANRGARHRQQEERPEDEGCVRPPCRARQRDTGCENR